MDNLNCKTQAHVRVSEENKLEQKIIAYLKIPLKDWPSDTTLETVKK